MSATKQLTEQEIVMLGEKWGATKYVVSDDIIDAYQDGKKVGVEGYITWMKDQQKKKLVEAMKYSTEAIKDLETKLNLKIVTAYIRQMAADADCFNKTLIVIDKNQYLSDKVKDAYNLLIKKSQGLRKEGIELDFALMPEKKYNTDVLKGDGFIFEYGEKKASRNS